MKSIRFRLLLAAMAVLLGTTISRSQTTDAPPMRGHEFAMHGHQMGFFSRALNLSDDQKAQMKTIMGKERPAMKPLFQQSRQIEQQLRQYAEGTFDEAKVRALATQKAQLEVEMTVQRTRIHNELFQVLTPDQQAKMKDLEARHEARMQEHMHQAPSAPPEQ
jgi:protein CpxP